MLLKIGGLDAKTYEKREKKGKKKKKKEQSNAIPKAVIWPPGDVTRVVHRRRPTIMCATRILTTFFYI